jgi:hypothetical protein
MAEHFRLAVRYGTPIDLPSVKAGFGMAEEPVGGTRVTKGGAEVSQTYNWRRTWSLNFGVITDAAAAEVRKWGSVRGYGLGPFELWVGDAVLPVLVNVVGRAPQPLTLGRQTFVLTLREVLL